MRVAFYAPLKHPDHKIPSGDRNLARLLIRALKSAEHEVVVASRYRSYSRSPSQQLQHREDSQKEIEIVKEMLQKKPPDIWFTYHLYYKAPDFLGPKISNYFGIPYIIAEASHAQKREHGAWKCGSNSVSKAITFADAIINLTHLDSVAVKPLIKKNAKTYFLPPFVDSIRFSKTQNEREDCRYRIAQNFNLSQNIPWVITVAMMRKDDSKLPSFLVLAEALRKVQSEYQLLVAGDGKVENKVKQLLTKAVGMRVKMLGQLSEDNLARLYRAGDIYVWPAVNEAFGISFLEAQASGLPIICQNYGGVSDIMKTGQTGFLVDKEDTIGFADAIDKLLTDTKLRNLMSIRAQQFVNEERSLSKTAKELDKILSATVLNSKN